MNIFRSSIFLALLAGGIASCKKAVADQTPAIISSCTSPPAPVVMVLLNTQGTSLVTTATDKVVVSYRENGQIRTIPCVVAPLVDAATRQPTTKYAGMAVGCDLGSYSIRQPNPIKSFQIAVNNQAVGTLYYDLQPNPARTMAGVQDCFQLLSFQLNTVAIQSDATVMPTVAVLNSAL